MTPWTAATLAEWTLDLDTGDLPDAVIAKAEDCIIDAIACAVPGGCADGARRVLSVAKSTFGKGDAVVWFETERLHPTGPPSPTPRRRRCWTLTTDSRFDCGVTGGATDH